MKARFLIVGIGVAVLLVLFLQWKENGRLVAANSKLATRIETLQAERVAVSPRARDPIAGNMGAADKRELLQLRHEVGQLREKAKELERVRTESAAQNKKGTAATEQTGSGTAMTNAPGFVARQAWSFAGYGTPEATLQSWVYSMSKGDLDACAASLIPEQQTAFREGKKSATKEELMAEAQKGAEKIAGYQIMGRESAGEDQVVLAVQVFATEGESRQHPMQFRRVGDEWKLVNYKGPPR